MRRSCERRVQLLLVSPMPAQALSFVDSGVLEQYRAYQVQQKAAADRQTQLDFEPIAKPIGPPAFAKVGMIASGLIAPTKPAAAINSA